LHSDLQWEYTKAAMIDTNGTLRWGQTKELNVPSGNLTIQLVGSEDSSLQIVRKFI
jgi:hypothetical protein